ncbi:TetR/AcrR family transcriptional regulator [Paenibacillus lacisoli]|nr:TetR/AcrR family transcriptional regulator [Paenibacillus sp. JX-17]
MKNKHRDELMSAGKELFMRQSFLTVNIKDVCETAGISRVTFYKHFQSLDELILEVQMDLLRRMTAYVEQSAPIEGRGKERLESMLNGWINFALDHPGYIRFILLFDLHYEAYISNRDLHERYQRFIREEKENVFLIDVLHAGVSDGSLQSGINVLETAYFIFTSMMGILQKMSLNRMDHIEEKLEHARMPQLLVTMLMQYLSH